MELFDRYIQTVYPSKEEALKAFQSRKLTFYLGIDGTGPDIHIGHTTNLLWLKKIQAQGPGVIVLLGDFTARVGDPTDKNAVRKALTEEEVDQNVSGYKKQVDRILKPGSYELKRNSEWLKNMTFTDLIKLTSHFTVQQM